ncbi:hypothetical protein C8Q76DRAFT_714349 [Earliella scabrosa]|nr:hypothetical protein C8Q76DRAFT_714349 [Earliella scabrosa]
MGVALLFHLYILPCDSSIFDLGRFCGWRTATSCSHPSRSAWIPRGPWWGSSAAYLSSISRNIVLNPILARTTWIPHP